MPAARDHRQGVALFQQAHVCTKFHHYVRHSQRQLSMSAYFTTRRAIKSGVGKQGLRQEKTSSEVAVGCGDESSTMVTVNTVRGEHQQGITMFTTCVLYAKGAPE